MVSQPNSATPLKTRCLRVDTAEQAAPCFAASAIGSLLISRLRKTCNEMQMLRRYVAEALKRGAGVATMEEADKIYVDDYCFFTWWMSFVHSYGGNTSNWEETGRMGQYPGGEMVTLYHSLIKHPRWIKSGGKDFVFFMPHPGMDHGPAHPAYNQLICEAFQGATFIVVERMQRLICNDFRQPIVVPYTANSKTHTCPLTPMPETGLLFYKGRCTPPTDFAAEGIALRHKVVSSLPKRPDITVACSPDKFDPTIQPESHMDMLESMSQHRFSLVLPGDTSSSRRLTDTMLAKSIPVFVGPPFHTLPFSEIVDYRAFSVFINVSSANVFLAGEKAGQPSNYRWHLPAGPTSDRGGNGHPGWLGQSEWWAPDIELQNVALQVENFEDIVPALLNISRTELTAKRQALNRASLVFRYSPSYVGGRSATHAILDEICLNTPQASLAEQ